MLAEVYDKVVDTSIAGVERTIPRIEIADFTQELFGLDTAPIIKRPSKRDLSLRYFWLGKLSHKCKNLNYLSWVSFSEFTRQSWILIVCAEISILIFLFTFFFVIKTMNTDTEAISKKLSAKYAFIDGFNLTLRALFNKQSNMDVKMQSFQLIRLVLMVQGFVILAYYKAMLNAALNVDVNNIPIETWEDVANSHYQILVSMGSADEDRFKDGNDIMKKIHREKILTVDPSIQLQNIGYEGSVEAILSNKYLAIDNIAFFANLDAYPCGIVEIPIPHLRYLIILVTP